MEMNTKQFLMNNNAKENKQTNRRGHDEAKQKN